MILNVSYSVFKEAALMNNVYYYSSSNGEIVAATGFNDNVFSTIIGASNLPDFSTNIQPRATEVFQEDDVVAKVLLESLSISLYDVTSTYIYIGSASPGSSASQSVWRIARFEFDVNGNPTNKKISNSGVSWNDRSSVTYY